MNIPYISAAAPPTSPTVKMRPNMETHASILDDLFATLFLFEKNIIFYSKTI